ncbi:hypothetical protein HPB49_025407 [Dermacentor silvarum]|uniref:Uncharacterized protein n=1 Tax=Dermacentor silvarum TaxID=543639 RepID=A0ACB8E4J1_DERSI|nr:hypothetical protein HPB49_025407 [Dermacentor silvarum]
MGDTHNNMSSDSQRDHSPPRARDTDASPPSQAVSDDPQTLSIPSAPIPIIHVPTRPPPGHPGWPPPAYNEGFRHVTLGSPPTPPGNYNPRVSRNGQPAGDRIDRSAPVRALESTRDHQPLLMMDAYTVPLQNAGANPLQYCMIGVLVAGLFVAAALVIIDSPGGRLSPHDLQPEKERSHPLHRLLARPVYDIQDVEDRDAVVVLPGADEQHSLGVQASAGNGPFERPGSTVTTTTVANDDDALDGEPFDWTAPKRQLRQDCSRYYYTYCTRPTTSAFHYDPEELACVPTTALGSQLCNRGTNRFTSWERCRAGCLQPDRVSDMCFENTLFMPCSKQDVAASFWYFNGTACTKWTFPHGRCPASQPGVYRTLGECSLQCVENSGPSGADFPRCGVPAPGECGPEHLRYPYFADMQAEGSARCVNASHATLLDRRCLVGNNQFGSMKACQRACQG